MADHKEDVEKELAGVTATFKEKSAALRASEGGEGLGSWTKQHAVALHEELDSALHNLKVKLTGSDHPAHSELVDKVDEAREDLRSELETVEEGDHHRAASIIDSFHRRVDQWMEDLQAEGREW